MVLPVNSRFLKEYKLVVIGGRGAGRSALTVQFIENRFPDDDPDYYYGNRKLCVIDEEVALIDVLDTFADEAYIAMREQYMRTGEGFLLVYSVTSRQSFEKVSTLHQEILRCKDNLNSFPMIVVANKCDLEHERMVGINEGRDLAKHLGCKFIETSAKYGVNVDEAFMNLVREIRKYNKKPQSRPKAVAAGKDQHQHSPGFCGCLVL
ncbi:hypothetical protein M413DRAFT_29800 [Hebeloma cylindrosporum]|uniref:Ras-like protein n=1 Tax=Hebeloma cylindrosporum TaxID=76867 RepID=A0A0C2XM99_HEBCY|nr:hypothetical protein M413DRAFT_29800 [Hebeloma cylindrosporum h7]